MPARISIATMFVIVALGTALLPAAAQGQATRTWVSGVGDDVNPCSRTAPCRTFAGAIGKTAAGGEMNALDPGGYGAVNITKAITIDASATVGGIIHASPSNGVTVNAGPADDVVLRGLDINGAGTVNQPPGCPNVSGPNGIRVLNGRSVTIDDTTIQHNTTAGLQLTPQTTDVKVLVNDVSISEGCQDGINAAPAAGRKLDVLVRDTTITNTETALRASGGAHVGLAGSAIFGNTTGLLTSGGGIIDDLGGNQIFGNVVNGTPTNAAKPPPPPQSTTAPTRTLAPPAPATARCTVPRLVGLKLASARKRLKRAHCGLGKVKRQRTRQRRRAGRVIAQRIKAGTKLPRAAKVGITVGRLASR